MTIRRAAINNAGNVWRLVQDFAPAFAPKREFFDQTFRSSLQTPQTLILVAEAGDASVVGYLLAHCQATFLANGPAVWVEEVMVAERARRQGVGQALMTEIESWAQAEGAVYVPTFT
jgi:GNAT superfamily N-acetyltransferase